MAVRVTATEVKEIIETDLTDAIVGAYITSANVFVNTVLGTGTTDILKEIERWLAAHMIASSKERQAIKEEAGTAKVQYSGKYEMNLSSTSYGQMVMSLDTTGAMAKVGLKAAYIYAIPNFN